MPFLFVQLANFGPRKDLPAESSWAELREAQTMALSLLNTGMAVTQDIGKFDNIHYLNKKDAGERLALAAEKVIFQETIVSSGPLYSSMSIDNDRIIIHFTDKGSGLMIRSGEALKGFEIAGADKKFVWANAQIENGDVVVWSDGVTKPIAVRYAWADSPDESNLYNKEGLPASSFRTDRPDVK